MRDTSVEVEAEFRKLIMARSPSERLAMACRMFETAKSLVLAGILREHGPLSPQALRKHLFLRLYGEDFDQDERDRIVQYLSGG